MNNILLSVINNSNTYEELIQLENNFNYIKSYNYLYEETKINLLLKKYHLDYFTKIHHKDEIVELINSNNSQILKFLYGLKETQNKSYEICRLFFIKHLTSNFLDIDSDYNIFFIYNKNDILKCLVVSYDIDNKSIYYFMNNIILLIEKNPQNNYLYYLNLFFDFIDKYYINLSFNEFLVLKEELKKSSIKNVYKNYIKFILLKLYHEDQIHEILLDY